MVIKSQKGSALVLALLIGFLGTIIGMTLYTVSSANAKQVQERSNKLQADYYAKSGVNLALGIIENNLADDENYLTGGDPAKYWGSLKGLSNQEPGDESYTIELKIIYEPKDDCYSIESTGYVRGGQQGSSASSSKVIYKIWRKDVIGGDPSDPGDEDTPQYPALDKIFAVGINPDSNKAINLKDNSHIRGNTAINSDLPSSISPNNSIIYYNIYGNLYIGPNGVARSFKPFVCPGYSVKNLETVKTFPLPVFPSAQFDGTTYSTVEYQNNRATINSSGQYEKIKVEKYETLYIDVSNQDILLQTENLIVDGNIIINQTGKGKVKLFVTNNFSLNGNGNSSYISQGIDLLKNITTNIDELYNFKKFVINNLKGTINAFENPDCLELYYSGKDQMTFNNHTIFFGSVYAETADIDINNHCLITGNIICGGSKVDLKENAHVVIYAPEASLEIASGAAVFGRIVARDIMLKSNSKIIYSDWLDTNFFRQLEWNLPDNSDDEEDNPPVNNTVNNIIQRGKWIKT